MDCKRALGMEEVYFGNGFSVRVSHSVHCSSSGKSRGAAGRGGNLTATVNWNNRLSSFTTVEQEQNWYSCKPTIPTFKLLHAVWQQPGRMAGKLAFRVFAIQQDIVNFEVKGFRFIFTDLAANPPPLCIYVVLLFYNHCYYQCNDLEIYYTRAIVPCESWCFS